MTTEYRRGIPGTAHVEAATRLGLLWHREACRPEIKTKFAIVRDLVESNYDASIDLESHTSPVLSDENNHSYRPIRPDGTPVDWEVLDQELARVGQAAAQPSAQPQGFRVDLWARICSWVESTYLPNITSVISIDDYGIVGQTRRYSWDTLGLDTQTDEADRQALIARWTVYQELKPLYDLVDGAQGEAAMPRDVIEEYGRRANASITSPHDWLLGRDTRSLFARFDASSLGTWRPLEGYYGVPLRNFAAVLDAVAERRVAERMRGQTQAPTVTPAQPEQHRHNWIYDGLGGGHNGQYNHNCACGERDWFAEPMSAPSPREAVVRSATATAQPEPRRFADVRPDRHGWRWWRITGAPDAGIVGARFEVTREQWRWLAMADGAAPTSNLVRPRSWTDSDVWDARTVIPTDEQGNPVSWDSIGPIDLTEIRLSSPPASPALDFYRRIDAANRAISQAIVIPLGPPPVGEMTRGVASYDGPVLTIDGARFEGPIDAIKFSDAYIPPPGASGWVTLSGLHDSMQALPRFGLIELDDDDRTGQSRQAPGPALRSGTIPTAAQVAKFRGALSRKLDSTLADAIKESKIHCEMSQYIIQRWAGGLGDEEAAEMIGLILRSGTSTMTVAAVDELARDILANWSPRFADLGNEPPRPTPSRGELEERRRRLAELQARLRAEREAQPAEELQEEPNRMALIEPDPAADPSASIRAWEERQEAAKLRPSPAAEREREPPRGPAVELVDATCLGSWLGRLYALANTDLPDTRLGARLGPRQRASG